VTKNPSKGWRDVLPVHPAAELFPPMTPEELRELADDIKAHGLREACSVIEVANSPYAWNGKPVALLDGRNRLDAIELTDLDIGKRWRVVSSRTDPYDYVLSANLHRRHLTSAQKREVAAKLLQANPTRSNRQVAAKLGISHHTVSAVRADQEARGQIAHVNVVTDTQGRTQPAHKIVAVQVAPASSDEPSAPADARLPWLPRSVPKAAPEPKDKATAKAMEILREAWLAVERADVKDRPRLRKEIETLISAATNVLDKMGTLQ
jgi:hypothetical protein